MPSIQYFRGIRVCRVWQDSFEWRVYKPGLHLQFCSQDIWGKKKNFTIWASFSNFETWEIVPVLDKL